MRFTKTSFALIIASAIAAFSSTAAFAQATVGYAFASHPIYAFKDNKSEIVATVRANDVILIDGGNCPIYFCQVWHPYTNTMGFMNAPFYAQPKDSIFPSKPAEGYATVTRQLTLRAAPMEASQALGHLYEGGRVKRERCEANYCYVSSGRGYQGWVPRSGIEDDRPLTINENIVRPFDNEIVGPVIVRPFPRP